VILLSDEIVAHSRERVVVDPNRNVTIKRRLARVGELPYGAVDEEGRSMMLRFGDGHNLLVTGSTHNEHGFRKTADAKVHDKLVRRLAMKIQENRDFLADVVVAGPSEAEWGIVSFGCTSRSVDEVMTTDTSASSIRSLRLRTLWPFPDKEIKEFAQTVERLLVPELNLGQLAGEVSRAVGESVGVVSLNKIGGGLMIEPNEIVAAIASV
jgi:2-oxoglutarate ferredoxin oxidoreductase subunit alpha